MTTFSDVTRYSSSALSTALAPQRQSSKPPRPSSGRCRRRDGTTYYPLSSLRRDQYEVVFLMEGGHEVLGFKLTPKQPRRVPFCPDLQGNAFADASYFVKLEDGGTSELPRSASPVAWRRRPRGMTVGDLSASSSMLASPTPGHGRL
jgi:hypothetical protein